MGIAERDGEGLVGLVQRISGYWDSDGLFGHTRLKGECASCRGVVGASGGVRCTGAARGGVFYRNPLAAGRAQGDCKRGFCGATGSLGDGCIGDGQTRRGVVVCDGSGCCGVGQCGVLGIAERDGEGLVDFVQRIPSHQYCEHLSGRVRLKGERAGCRGVVHPGDSCLARGGILHRDSLCTGRAECHRKGGVGTLPGRHVGDAQARLRVRRFSDEAEEDKKDSRKEIGAS